MDGAIGKTLQIGSTRRPLEGFFAKLTRRRLKNGIFHSLVDLEAAINRFIREYNANDPKPFVGKANPDDIIAARIEGSKRWSQSTRVFDPGF